MRWLMFGFVLILVLLAIPAAAVVPVAPTAKTTSTVDAALLPRKPTVPPGRPLIVDEPGPTPAGMVWIPGGTFIMGDRRGAPHKHPEHLEEIPEHHDAQYEHEVVLDGFWMD